MKNCPEHIVHYMHEYLDGDLDKEQEQEFKQHLHECKDCYQQFHDLEKAMALVQSTSHISAPNDFTQRVMNSLPKEKKTIGWNRWMRTHPVMVAAAIFFFLMGASLFGGWQEEKFAFTNQPNLVVENDTVIVPEGKVVDGDIVVKNGNLRIEGEVRGNVTVINGEQYLASAGTVTGEIEEIDQLFEWIWFTIKDGFKSAINIFND
ncbi:anti-sigma factor family protein [Sutcliffiella rhizosphaerae]|uniref:Anti-sigma-W factor RsiW n=1 Tax=Sutcliffiella rhizosphaerae TaxID=2880967 RepID=A0ABM8YTK0_9BACI|nr:anti-sigma factor [Sutcliffiella rhizosphaerae]CAG9623280.1 Anti-sigma-W factor RsiW [Sutcliffiella rhizosphaerae]